MQCSETYISSEKKWGFASISNGKLTSHNYNYIMRTCTIENERVVGNQCCHEQEYDGIWQT